MLRFDQACRRINVSPKAIADRHRLHGTGRNQLTNTAGEGGVASCGGVLQRFKEGWSTQKESGINRIVLLQIFTNRANVATIELHFGGIIKIENLINAMVYGQQRRLCVASGGDK
jgi:hypothetical protein